MSAVLSEVAGTVMELRSAALTLIAVVLKTTDLNVLAGELEQRASATPGLFDEEPVALDLSQVREPEPPLSFPDLIALFRRHHMLPVAVRGGSAEQMAAAFAAGLVEAPEGARPARELVLAPPAAPERIVKVQLPPLAPLIIDRPVRSGPKMVAQGRELVGVVAKHVQIQPMDVRVSFERQPASQVVRVKVEPPQPARA